MSGSHRHPPELPSSPELRRTHAFELPRLQLLGRVVRSLLFEELPVRAIDYDGAGRRGVDEPAGEVTTGPK